MGILRVSFSVFASRLWACAGMEIKGEERIGLLSVCSVSIVASASFLASVPCAGTMTARRGATGSGPVTGAGEIGGRMVNADAAADTGEESVIVTSWLPPPSPSFAQVYTVLMVGGVSVAVVVDPAAVKIVVCVSTMVMIGSEIVFGAVAVVHADLRPLEGMISLRGVMRALGVFGIRGFEKVKVLRLTGDIAPPLTKGKAGVGSL